MQCNKVPPKRYHFFKIVKPWNFLCGAQTGEQLLREHVFIHLSSPADKLGALLAMAAKLFALAAGLCGEDNADALSSHEALLPGALLQKFTADKLAECLTVFTRQASRLTPFAGSECPSETLQPWGNPFWESLGWLTG